MPALTDTRNEYMRYTTRQYILDEPTTIVLKRKTEIAKPGGGHDKTRLALAPQTFRFTNQDITGGMTFGQGDAEAHRFTYVLIGQHDADIEIDDIWEDGKDQYRVDALIPNNGWETRAYVTLFSTEPEHG